MGHKDSPLDLPSTKQLFGARRMNLQGNADFSKYVDRVRDQGQLSCCVGMAFARVLHVRGQMERFKAPNPLGVAYPSELGIYALAREEEADGPLVDEGSSPSLALQALQQDVGVPLERDWPFKPEEVNELLPADVIAKAMALKVTEAYAVDSEGENRVDDCMQALLEGYPFEMAIQVGNNYENCTSQKPVMPETGTIYGGHSISIVGCKTVNGRRLFLNVGSWGPKFGFGGYAWLDESVIVDPRTSNIIVVQVVPDPS